MSEVVEVGVCCWCIGTGTETHQYHDALGLSYGQCMPVTVRLPKPVLGGPLFPVEDDFWLVSLPPFLQVTSLPDATELHSFPEPLVGAIELLESQYQDNQVTSDALLSTARLFADYGVASIALAYAQQGRDLAKAEMLAGGVTNHNHQQAHLIASQIFAQYDEIDLSLNALELSKQEM